MSRKKTIQQRQRYQQEKLLEQLKRTPIIQVACEKSGISRATFYRWKKRNRKFGSAADAAIFDGKSLVSDMAESKLITAIKEQNMTAIIFWLKHHHPQYANRLELELQQPADEKLTPQQAQLVKRALALAALIEPESTVSSAAQTKAKDPKKT